MNIIKVIITIFWFFIYINIFLNTSLRNLLISTAMSFPSLSPWLLVLGQIVFSLLLLPCSIFTIIFGMAWGFKYGVVYSVIGSILSSCITFYLGKYIINHDFFKRNKKLFDKISKHILNYGWKSSFIAHINPLFPGSSIGFIFGASSLNFRSFILGAVLGTLPLQVILVFSGTIGDYFLSVF